MQKVVLIDNYDSFTYNILQYLSSLGAKVLVFKNDEITLNELQEIEFSHLVISPGPGNPNVEADFGVCRDAIKFFFDKKPILGVCLGHQGIAAVYGANIENAPEIMHGMRSKVIKVKDSILFKGIKDEFEVMRYHSLIVVEKSLSDMFVVTVKTQDKGLVMAFEHKSLPVFGIQFHPESIGTLDGMKILENFLSVK
jgi:anthranilate synthase/aminodeoxychorismate synthase-like glutamine amidotransferase